MSFGKRKSLVPWPTSVFTVHSGATLRASVVGVGSTVTANLNDVSALANATVNLTSGNLILDPVASTAANGIGSKYIANAGSTTLATTDFLNTAAIVNAPTFQTAAVANANGQAGTFSFGTNNPAASNSSSSQAVGSLSPWRRTRTLPSCRPITFPVRK